MLLKKPMKSAEIKEKFLGFFAFQGHAIIPSASLIPENDPTVLFTTAGMHPLVPYLLGEKHSQGKRLVNSQRCVRTGDLNEIGDAWHMTYFEMLGNWSLGDYWKKETIKWAWEFLTQELKINDQELEITCFAGDEDAPRDEEAAEIWRSLGINNLKFLGKEDNWWGPAGKTGPCGPDTEIFWQGVEIWNLVFMEYHKTQEGKFEARKQKNVDTGMGLARITALLNGKKSVYDTDIYFKGIKTREQRIVADHVLAATEIIKDGVSPGKVEQGYVLRKLLRRALKYNQDLVSIAKNFTPEEKILKTIKSEQDKFNQALNRGLKELERGKKTPFDLYQGFGLSLETIKKYTSVDEAEFNKKLSEHQEKSRTATQGRFKAGLADQSRETTKLHTATHLLQQALKDVLGNHVSQAGSNITSERLRFDFTHQKKLTPEELSQVEKIVNQKIKEKLPVSKNIAGEISHYHIGDYSREKCAGPHVKNTGELSGFKILKEESSSYGVRRIKAILE